MQVAYCKTLKEHTVCKKPVGDIVPGVVVSYSLLQYLINPEQGSKNVLSGNAGKVDFLAGQVTFKA